ncbi:MAG: DNA polymerase III subunit delta [Desulfobulbaceae bacterium]|nr:DNA polymerase III subunit delta [Desulfobulbaceae bacterium]
MALFVPQQLPVLLETFDQSPPRAVLLFGESYLCRSTAARIEEALLADGGVLHAIDGDEEDVHETFARISSYSLLSGRQVYRVSNTRLLYSKNSAKTLWERVLKARTNAQDEHIRKALSAFIGAAGLPLQEDILHGMSAAQWQKNFNFAQPGDDLNWTSPYLSTTKEQEGASTAGVDTGDQLISLLTRGLPPANVLILLAAEVDKRKKLFKYLKENEVIIDCSVAEGSGSKAKDAQMAVLHSLLATTLNEQKKKLPPNLVSILFERVGFHPVALVNELRKLMLAAGERETISREDIDELVGRTRQDAIYELTGAIAKGELDEALVILQRLLDSGVYHLAVMASLRNYVRSALLYRSLIETCGLPFSPSMNFNTFQQRYLPVLKEQGDEWQKELAAHPYALFNQFKDAFQQPLSALVTWMELLLEAELRLKDSGAKEELVLHRLVCSMLTPPSPSTTPAHAPSLAKSFSSITIQY